MRIVRWILVLALLPAAGCDGGLADGGAPADNGGKQALAAAPSEPEPETDAAAPRRIYYDLGEFDWYRRGEPLRVEGAAYVLGGPPVRADARSLELAGTYEGVDYYRSTEQGGPDAVYVPVFERYWQPFVPQAARPADRD